MFYECEFCGLSEFDLPDGVEPDLIFETLYSGETACQGCAITEESAYDWEDDFGEEDEEANG